MRMISREFRYFIRMVCGAYFCVTSIAHADLDASLSSDLDLNTHSSLLSLNGSTSYEPVALSSEVTAEYSSSYKQQQNFTDALNGKISATLLKTLKPMLGLSAAQSIRDKYTTLGIHSGATIQTKLSRFSLAWNPTGSLKNTTFKTNSGGNANSSKQSKKANPSIVQYGLGNTLTLSDGSSKSLSVFYNSYFYNADIAQITSFPNSAGKVLSNKKSFETLSGQLSAYAASLWGLAFAYPISESLDLKAEYYRTTLKSDLSTTDLLIGKLDFEFNDKLESYVQVEFTKSWSLSQKYTLAAPYSWTDQLSSELGLAQSRTETEKTWSVLMAINYAMERPSGEITAGNQNQ